MTWEISLRHPGQLGSIGIDVRKGERDSASLAKTFVEHHGRHFGYSDPSAAIEIVSLRAIGRGRLPPVRLTAASPKSGTPEVLETRPVYFDEVSDFVSTKIYRGSQISPGMSLNGPAIVEEDTMTVVIGPYDTSKVDAFGNYLVEIQHER
jgi:N-methylhydantoinase A